MFKQAQSLISAVVLVCVLIIAAAIVLSLSRPSAPFNGAAARPVATDTPLPPLPVPTFYLPRYETPTSPPPLPKQLPAPLVTVEPYPPTDVIGTPLPGTLVTPIPKLDPTTQAVLATEAAITPSPWPTRFHVTPDSAWRRYIDPNLGFSFVYPANWFVRAYTYPNYKLTLRSQCDGLQLAQGVKS
ncbi:MAG: hypothetical protein KatS3mg053_4022 [Candidatus Roseilinea sp.]|nr:MAG: hypothetical protein KatS3mg053_4022 [Candidatus Roseilinea sp.]